MSEDPNRGARSVPPRQQAYPGPQPQGGAPANPGVQDSPAPNAAPPPPPQAPPVPADHPPPEASHQVPPEQPQASGDQTTDSRQPFATFHTADAFNDRVGRAVRAQIQKQYGMSPDELSGLIETSNQQKQAEEERRQAEMTEVDRAKTAAAEAEQRARAAEEARDVAELNAHLSTIFSQRGIKNFDYAKFKVLQRLEELGEGEELDEGQYIDELLRDPSTAYSFGVTQSVTVPAGTSPAPGGPAGTPGAPPQANPPNAAPETPDAFKMPADAWAAKQRALGLT